MKRSGFQNRGKPLERTQPMNRGAGTLKPGGPLARTSGLKPAGKPMRSRSKTNSDPRPKTGEAELCRGQPCYLAIPGVCCRDPATVVPAHSNQARHGKGRGIKAFDAFTIPACWACHAEIDSGKRFTREEKFALWDAAYERWSQDRNALILSDASRK